MRDNRRLGIVVAVALAVAVGTGGGSAVSDPLFPPGVEDLLPHAVVLWQAEVLGARTPEQIQVVAILDIDGDGAVDVLASFRNGPVILWGDGTGQFARGCSDFYEAETKPLGGGAFSIRPLASMTALSGSVLLVEDEALVVIATTGLRSPGESDGYWLYTFAFERRTRCLKRKAVREIPFPLHFLQPWDLPDGSGRLLGVSVQDGQTLGVSLDYDGETFSDPVIVAEGRGWPVHWGDIAGNGLPELVLRHREAITVLPASVDGGLGPAVYVTIPGQRIRDVAVGDVTGDGATELAVLSVGGQLVLFGWNGLLLEGFARQTLELAYEPTSIHLADMTGDGVLDLIARGGYGQRVSVLAGKGGGTFHSVGSEFWLPVPSGRAWTVDLTGNGRADLVAASPYEVYVFLNGGCPRGTSQLPVGEVLAAGDLSGNGAADLVVRAGQGLDVLWNNGEGAFVRSPFTRFPEVGPGATVVAHNGFSTETVTEEDGTMWTLRWLRPVAAQVVEGGVVVLLERTEADRWYIRERVVHELRWLGPAGTQLRALRVPEEKIVPFVGVGDLDGDGGVDVVVLSQETVWVWWNGEDARAYPLPDATNLLAVGDVTGDGVDDVVVVAAGQEAAYVAALSFPNRALVLSEPLVVFDLFSIPLAVALGDFDGDGVKDVAVAATRLQVDVDRGEVALQGVELSIYRSQRGHEIITIPSWPEGDAPWPLDGLAVGDFDGDGQLDLALTTVGGAGVFLLWGEEGGKPTGPQWLRLPAGAMLTADLDGNGQPELIAQLVGLTPATWILWNGGGR